LEVELRTNTHTTIGAAFDAALRMGKRTVAKKERSKPVNERSGTPLKKNKERIIQGFANGFGVPVI